MGFKVIKCPHCGREYVPAEIYYPNSFFGRPKVVYLDNDRHVISIDGDDMDLYEEYTCDDCRTVFRVKADIDFTTEEIVNFEEDFTSELYGDRVSLEEPE